MRWNVKGAHKDTGELVSIGIVAETSGEAVRAANRKGIVVSGRPEPIEDTARSDAAGQQAAGITWVTIARGVFWGMWAYSITAGIITFLIGILVGLWTFAGSVP